MSHADTLVTAASLIAGFGSAVIAFRLQRELDIEEKNEQRPPHLREQHWFPASDWLIVASNIGALCFVVAPLVALDSPSPRMVRLASAACCAAAIMLAGYIPSILAHYRFLVGLTKERSNPTFWEGAFLLCTVIGACAAFALTYRA
ncbi:MAG: hypothetical protein WAK94_16130 [Steroidobacteraceae bacterium]